MWRYLLPLAVFIVLVVFLSIGLQLDPKKIPSPLIGKTAPGFQLPDLLDAEKTVSPDQYKGKVWLLNVWASWCVSCRAEHQVLNELARSLGDVQIVGLNYKDASEDGQRWLAQRGNPYVANAFDLKGKAGIDWGVYGVPETFVIDSNGLVQYKHTGPLDWQSVQQDLMPVLQKLTENNRAVQN